MLPEQPVRHEKISIHALREEGDPGKAERAGLRGAISIHALREEGDLWPCCAFTTAIISIHALREEGDSGITVGQYVSDQFLSTPSARRATESRGESIADMQEFLSTPSARRATVRPGIFDDFFQYFYPRPPRGGRPAPSPPSANSCKSFLSTPSARRATRGVHKTE